MAKNQGGYKPLAKFKTGQQALIYHLFERLGGPTEVSHILGDVTPNQAFTWRYRGKVPMKQVKSIAKRLSMPYWGLNYEDIATYEGKAPSWERVVKAYRLPEKIVESIMFYKPPKVRNVEIKE